MHTLRYATNLTAGLLSVILENDLNLDSLLFIKLTLSTYQKSEKVELKFNYGPFIDKDSRVLGNTEWHKLVNF
jgi:hypothetical protein